MELIAERSIISLEDLDFDPHWRCEGRDGDSPCEREARWLATAGMRCAHNDQLICDAHCEYLKSFPSWKIWECLIDGAEGRLLRIVRLPRG